MSVNRLLLLVSVLCCGAVQCLPQQTPQYTVQSEDGTPLDLGEPPRVQSEQVSMIFDNRPVLVNPGEALNLECGVSGDYRYCHWDNGKQAAIQVQDVYDGYIDGLSKPAVSKGNECGIIVNSVNIQDHGMWTCKVFVIGQTLVGHKNVTVTIKPTNPVLEVPRRPLFVDEGDQPNIKCSVAAARPKVDIRWFLGEEDITYNSQTENTIEGNGAFKSISTLSQMFNAWHNNKILRCVVFHYTLETPVEDYVDVAVRYKPFGKDVRLYGIKLGDDVEAKVNFSSNPVPIHIKWGYGLSFEDVVAQLPVPGEEGRYSTEMVQLEDGYYSVILRTLEFQEGDAHLSFKVSVENELGVRDFRVTISNDKPPNEPLSSGTLATIVIAVLLVILFLLCAVYMRYNRLYCFAAKKDAKEDKEASGTSSDTESTQAPAVTNGQHKNGTKPSLFSKLHKKSKQTEKPAPDQPEETTTLPDKPTDEVVYAELDLAPGDKKPLAEKTDPSLDEGTEYAQIVGVLKNQE